MKKYKVYNIMQLKMRINEVETLNYLEYTRRLKEIQLKLI